MVFPSLVICLNSEGPGIKQSALLAGLTADFKAISLNPCCSEFSNGVSGI